MTKRFNVGYKNPPIETRFRPGQSGNPKGRPKKVKSVDDFLIEELTAEHFATINGERKKIPGVRLIAKALFQRAATGRDPKLALYLLDRLTSLQKHTRSAEIEYNRKEFQKRLEGMSDDEMNTLYIATLAELNRDSREDDDR